MSEIKKRVGPESSLGMTLFPEAGIKLNRVQEGMLVFVNWVTAKQTILRGTRFEKETEAALAGIAKGMDGYDLAKRERLAGHQARGCWFFVSNMEISGEDL